MLHYQITLPDFSEFVKQLNRWLFSAQCFTLFFINTKCATVRSRTNFVFFINIVLPLSLLMLNSVASDGKRP